MVVIIVTALMPAPLNYQQAATAITALRRFTMLAATATTGAVLCPLPTPVANRK